MTIAERVSLFIAAALERTALVFTGEITKAQAEQANEEAAMRLRTELSDEDFQQVMDGVAADTYKRTSELSSLGHPIPGNDPIKPN